MFLKSPDGRGIDCALLINDQIKLLNYDFIFVNIPNEKRTTRDILFAKLKLNDKIINVFVNHWLSRFGGQKNQIIKEFLLQIRFETISTLTFPKRLYFNNGRF